MNKLKKLLLYATEAERNSDDYKAEVAKLIKELKDKFDGNTGKNTKRKKTD